jgi:hypothetical protein
VFVVRRPSSVVRRPSLVVHRSSVVGRFTFQPEVAMHQTQTAPSPTVRLRLVALPTEHGGWGFLLEPILLGLLLAPTVAGALLGLAALGAFLARHPLELALTDWRRGKRYPRTVWAERFAIGYGLLAIVGFGGALWLSTAPFWPALLVAGPPALVQLSYDLRKQQRRLLPEWAGAAALAALAPMLLLAAGWSFVAAFAIWGVLVTRSVAAIMYVRVRIRRLRGVAASATPALAAHLISLALVLGGAIVALVPWTAVVAFVLLLFRAIYGVSGRSRPTRASAIGFQELFFGLLTIALLAAGYVR